MIRFLNKLSAVLGAWFGLLVFGVAWGAVYLPVSLKSGLPYVPLMLSVVMTGVGLTLNFEEFAELFRRPWMVLVGVLAQFMVMPLLGFSLAWLLHLPMELSVGLILVGCCPGGTASNLMTYLSKGDVALSVSLTGLTTLLAPVVTPMLLFLLARHWVIVDPYKMFLSIGQIVILPVTLGCTLRRFLPNLVQRVVPAMPILSILAILSIIAVVMNVNAQRLFTANLWVFPAVLLHNGLGMLAGNRIAKAIGMTPAQQRALTFEVGMQDSGLGVALAVAQFGPLYALPSAIFSVCQNMAAPVLTFFFSRHHASADVYQAEKTPALHP